MTAAVFSPTAAATAARSFRGTKRTPGTSGSKGSRYLAVQVVESAPIVRPWKERSKATYSIRPCSFPIRRANFIAPSQPRCPSCVKKTFDGKASRDEALGERARGLGVVEVARVDERLGLLLDGGDDLRVAVAEAVHRDAGGEVEARAAVLVQEARPLPLTRMMSRS